MTVQQRQTFLFIGCSPDCQRSAETCQFDDEQASFSLKVLLAFCSMKCILQMPSQGNAAIADQSRLRRERASDCAGALQADAIWGRSVQKTAAFDVLWQFVVATLCSEIEKAGHPQTAKEMQRLASLMTIKGNKSVDCHGCFLVLDGRTVRVVAPTNNDVPNPASQKSKKSF